MEIVVAIAVIAFGIVGVVVSLLRPVHTLRVFGAAILAVVVILAVVATQTDCAWCFDDSPEKRTSSRSFEDLRVTTLEMESSSGDITIGASDRFVVETTERFSKGRITDPRAVITDGALVLSDRCDERRRSGTCSVSYKIGLPKEVAITIRSADGDIDIGRMASRITVETANGDISGFDVTSAEVAAQSRNGDIEFSVLAEPKTISLETRNGDVHATVPDGMTYAVDAFTTRGDRDVNAPTDATSPRSIRLRTTNGDVSVATR